MTRLRTQRLAREAQERDTSVCRLGRGVRIDPTAVRYASFRDDWPVVPATSAPGFGPRGFLAPIQRPIS